MEIHTVFITIWIQHKNFSFTNFYFSRCSLKLIMLQTVLKLPERRSFYIYMLRRGNLFACVVQLQHMRSSVA